MNKDQVIARIDSLLPKASSPSADYSKLRMEIFSGTLSLICSIYGEHSQQVESLYKLRDKAFEHDFIMPEIMGILIPGIFGILSNLKTEVECGLLDNLKHRFTGDILSDFVQLAHEAISENEEGAKDVAAVLAAAAFEDTIRRMGSEYAGITDRPKLSDVINTLKEKEILKGPQVGIANSYLKFRNDALHADWEKIESASIHSVLGFVEQLLLKHFG